MYKENFRNQAVKEVKNGSTASSVARKFDIAPSTLTKWINVYDENMYKIMRDENVPEAPVIKPKTGIRLKSIKVIIGGAAVTLVRNDVLKLLSFFDEFEKEQENGNENCIWEKRKRKGYGGSLITILTHQRNSLVRLTIIVMETSQ